MSNRSTTRLRRLLDLRRRQEERARTDLATSLQRVSALSDEVRQRSDALEAVLRGQQPDRKRRVEAIADAASVAILAARAAEASAMHTADEMRRAWRRAVRRVDGLERVEERMQEAEKLEQRRADQAALDEAVAVRATPVEERP